MRAITRFLCVAMMSAFTGCSTHEPPLPSQLHVGARSIPLLRIEEQIGEMVRTSGDWEMAQFRSYGQQDLDGDGIDDAILLTTFEHALVWRRELFVCLTSSPVRVMHVSLGGKGERSAEDFDIKDRTIIVRGKTYTDADAMCCPSEPYETAFLVVNGRIVKRR